MITKAYIDYIKSEKWQQKRQQYFMVYGRKCQACGTTKGPIHVHHMSYANLGNEPLSDLIGLCAKHHRAVTRIYRRNRRRGLRRVTMEYVQRVRNGKSSGST